MALGSQTFGKTNTTSTNTHQHNSSAQKETTPIQVALRIRPLTVQDRAQPRFSHSTESDVIKVCDNTIIVAPHQKSFTFDHVFDPQSTQEQVFTTVASKLVDRFIDGYNVTILAYGQTSSGKTYTMGTEIGDRGGSDPVQEGIIPRAMTALFQRLQEAQLACHQRTAKRPVGFGPTPTPSLSSAVGLRTPAKRLLPSRSATRLRPVSMMTPPGSPEKNPVESKLPRNTIKVSFVEIYNEELVDLLNPAASSERSPVSIREDPKGQIYWTGVKEVAVESAEDVLRHLELGTLNRATGSTDMNAKSSRSHAIFSVTLRQEKWVPSVEPKASLSTQAEKRAVDSGPTPVSSRSSMISTPLGKRASTLNVRAMVGQMEKNAQKTTMPEEEGKWVVSHSKFHFVDLAGSERLKRTAAEGDRRKEGININAGLLALGNVISALADTSKRAAHIPYRDSKLTRLLQDSLGGNATTLMIACISPAEVNLTETINTIKYAHRARHIKNKVERNEAEEWMTNDNTEYLRGIITKLKAEVRTLKAAHQPSSPTKSRLHPTEDSSPSSSLSDTDRHPISTCPSTSVTTTITVPDTTDVDHQAVLADLRRQIEELNNQMTVTRERNQHVEQELRQTRKAAQQPAARDLDFQHLVEPVIEEYEKSISSLESQLAMARAALSHSEQVLAEQEAKIAEYTAARNTETNALTDLKAKLAESMEHEQKNASYIATLEAKLVKAGQDAEHDQHVLDNLKQKILKLRETDESTEQYIADLESQLSMSEKQRSQYAAVVQETQQKICDQEAYIESIKQQLSHVESQSAQIPLLEKLEKAESRCRVLECELLQLKEAAMKRDAQAISVRDAAVDPIPIVETTTATQTHGKDDSVLLKELEQQVQSKTLQIERLEKELAEIKPMRDELVQLKEQQATEIARLEVYIATTKQEFAQCQEDLAVSREQTNDLKLASEKMMDKLNSEIASLESNQRGQKEALEAAEAEIKALTRHIDEQERHMQSLLQLRLKELEHANHESRTLSLIQGKQEAIILELERKTATMGTLVDQLQQQLVDRERHIEQLEADNCEKESYVLKTQSDLERIFQHVRLVGMEKNQMQRVVQVLEGMLLQQEQKMDRATDVLHTLQGQYALHASELYKTQCAMEQLTVEKETLHSSLTAMSKQASENAAQTVQLQQELCVANNTLKERETEIGQLRADFEGALDSTESAALRSKVEELEKLLDLKREEQEALQMSLAEKERQLSKVHRDLDEQRAKTTSLEKAITDLENTLQVERLAIFTKSSCATTEHPVSSQAHSEVSDNQDDNNNKAELQAKLEQAVHELEQTRKTNVEQQRVIQTLEESLQSMHHQLDEAVASHSQKSEQIQSLQEQLSQRRRLTVDSGLSRGSSFTDEKTSDTQELPSATVVANDDMSESPITSNLRVQFRSKALEPEGANELVDSLIQLTTENAQLAVQVSDLESQLILQRNQLTLESENLELEVMKLTAANERLEKELEQVMPRSQSNTNSTNVSSRDPMNMASPPQTPRVSSPISALGLHYKLQRDSSTSSLGKLRKSGSYRSVPSMEYREDTRLKRMSTNTFRAPEPSKSTGHILSSRVKSMSVSPPPPSAPPSNPLPPIPSTSASVSLLDGHTFPSVPERSISTPVLDRQNSTASTISDMIHNGGNYTAEQYTKIIRSLQRKIHVADNDVRAHQEVISKLECQLSRSENTVREVKRQMETMGREKDTCLLEIQSLRQRVNQAENGQLTVTENGDERCRRLEQELENERRLKEKAEKARRILENRMDELMNKRNKFMCF